MSARQDKSTTPNPRKARAIVTEYASVAHLCVVASRHHQQAVVQHALGKQRERLDGQTDVFFSLVSARRHKQVTWKCSGKTQHAANNGGGDEHSRIIAYAPINGQKHGAPPQLLQHLAIRLRRRGEGDTRVQNAGLSLCRGKRAHENSLGEPGVHDYGVCEKSAVLLGGIERDSAM